MISFDSRIWFSPGWFLSVWMCFRQKTVRRNRAFFRVQLGNVQRVGIGGTCGRLVVVVCGGADTWLEICQLFLHHILFILLFLEGGPTGQYNQFPNIGHKLLLKLARCIEPKLFTISSRQLGNLFCPFFFCFLGNRASSTWRLGRPIRPDSRSIPTPRSSRWSPITIIPVTRAPRPRSLFCSRRFWSFSRTGSTVMGPGSISRARMMSMSLLFLVTFCAWFTPRSVTLFTRRFVSIFTFFRFLVRFFLCLFRLFLF